MHGSACIISCSFLHLAHLSQDDTQLVSILYRTHKSLPATAKVSSLYVFDALSRAARNQVTKHGLTGDINSEKGNPATFLLKVEGVLEGLFQDMMSPSNSENKVSPYFTNKFSWVLPISSHRQPMLRFAT
jgi:hypothetical protein